MKLNPQHRGMLWVFNFYFSYLNFYIGYLNVFSEFEGQTCKNTTLAPE